MAVDSSEISIIIPLRDGDSADKLLSQLQNIKAEIIVSTEGSRAKSLNTGAAKAGRKFLWFLHADSTLPENALEKLQKSLQQNDEALHYFRLKFYNGPAFMTLNGSGANLRSRFFGAPFGDQGLCIRKDLFFKIGGFPEEASYGEDHLFVWHARRHGVKLKLVAATLNTSAQRYIEKGWLKTTLCYQYLWIKQALPQYWLLIRNK